jgi:membrane-associated phospholipid phosphatase
LFSALMAFLAEYFYLVVLGLAVCFLAVYFYLHRGELGQRGRALELVAAVVCIGGVAFLLAQIGTHLIDSPRPFLVSGQPPLIPSSVDNGFPSDHTLLLAVAAAVITLTNRWWGLLFWGLAVVVGLARIYAGVHHLVDVAGSLAIVLVAFGVFLLLRQIAGRRSMSGG